MKKIAVVGSGISGLGAAHALQECHCDVIVFEGENSVGGRMQTMTLNGYYWDPAAQFLLDRYTTARTLMKELEIPYARDVVDSTMGVFLLPKSMYYFDMNNPFSVFHHPLLSYSTKLKQVKLLLQTLWHWTDLDFPWMRRVQKLDTNKNLRMIDDREYGADAVDYFLGLHSSNMFLWRPEDTPWWMAMMSLKMMFNTKMLLPAGGMGTVTKVLASNNTTLRRSIHSPPYTDITHFYDRAFMTYFSRLSNKGSAKKLNSYALPSCYPVSVLPRTTESTLHIHMLTFHLVGLL